jgi:hypothetical protein
VFAHTGTPSCISSGRGEEDGATRRRFSLATDALGVRDATYAVGTEEGFTGLALNRRFALPCITSTCGAETVLRRPWLDRKGWFSLKGEIGCGALFLRIEDGVIERRHGRSAGRIAISAVVEWRLPCPLLKDECTLGGGKSRRALKIQQGSRASASGTWGWHCTSPPSIWESGFEV